MKEFKSGSSGAIYSEKERFRYVHLFLSFCAGILTYPSGWIGRFLWMLCTFHLLNRYSLIPLLIIAFTLGNFHRALYEKKVEKYLSGKEKEVVIYAKEIRKSGDKFFVLKKGKWFEIEKGYIKSRPFNIIVKSREERISEGIISCKLENLKDSKNVFKRYLYFSGYPYLCSSAENLSDIEEEKSRINKGIKNISIVRAIVYGEKWGIGKEERKIYRISGISHLLAISGFHMFVLYAFSFFAVYLIVRILCIFFFFKRILMNLNTKKLSAFLSIVLCFFYLYLTDFPVSAKRAFIVLFVYSLTYLFELSANPWEVLALSGIVILLLNPLELYSISFQLSFTAVAGVVLFYHQIKTRILGNKRSIHGYILEIILVTVSVLICTAPVTLYHFSTLNFSSILSNVLAIPIYSVVVPLSFVGELIGESSAYGLFFLKPADILLSLFHQFLLWAQPFFKHLIIDYKPDWLFMSAYVSILSAFLIRRGVKVFLWIFLFVAYLFLSYNSYLRLM